MENISIDNTLGTVVKSITQIDSDNASTQLQRLQTANAPVDNYQTKGKGNISNDITRSQWL